MITEEHFEKIRDVVTPLQAAQVLWWHSHGAPAQEPGDFHKYLIMAMMHADQGNLDKLVNAFPGLAVAVHIYKNEPWGLTVLTAIATKEA